MAALAAPAELRLGLAPNELAERVAVVTGAGGGIGRAAALWLARLGASVVVAEVDEATGSETARLIEAEEGRAAFVRTDVSREADVARLAMWTLADFGPADILVNNAALSPVASVLDTEPDLFDRTVAVNLRGAYLTCRAFLPSMLARGQGTIVNMVSTDAMAHMATYIATKAGITGFSQSLAAEVGHQQIRVIALAPGFVDTPGLRAAGERLAPTLGMTPQAFGRLSFHHAYEGMMPADHAGSATALLIARYADQYHGEVVTGYTVLERAGALDMPIAVAQAAATAMPAASAVALSRELQAMIAETEAEFSKLPVFVRPLARSGFKRKAGLSLQDWGLTAAALTRVLEVGAPVRPDMQRLLEQLLSYYQGVPAETARFTKDAALLQQVSDTVARRVAAIRALSEAIV